MTAKLHPLLLAQESLGEADLPRVGAKNAGLGLLAGLGLATPRGYALTTEAFRLHLEAAGVVLSDIAQDEAGAEAARHRLLETPLAPCIAEAVAEAHERLAPPLGLAVRSSLYPFEDDPRHACAGLFVSELALRTQAALENAVRGCFASLLEEAVRAYFSHHGLALAIARMSVGLQHTVAAVASATVFTEDPVTLSDRLVYVDATHGFGGVTNSALVETDTFFVAKPSPAGPGHVVLRRKGTKRRRLSVRSHEGEGLELLPNTSMGFALEDDVLLQIAADATKIEAARGCPQDIELAVTREGRVVYLQTRAQRRAFRGLLEHSLDLAPGASPATRLAEGTGVVYGMASAKLQPHRDTSRNADAIILKEAIAVHEVPKLYGAKGLVVRQLPATSHPAIHLREIGVPTLAVGDAFVSLAEHVGRETTLDAGQDRGALYLHRVPFTTHEIPASSAPRTRTGVHLLTAFPSTSWCAFVRDSAIEGLHVRGESVNNDDIRTHPIALLDYDEERVEGGDRYLIERRISGYATGAAFYEAKFAERLALLRATLRPDQLLTLRLTDLQTPDYRRMIGGASREGEEQNPSMGLRGAARLTHARYRAIMEMEVRALRRAMETAPGAYRLLVPVVRVSEELRLVRRCLEENGLDVPLGMMVETPAAVFLADEFRHLADFFCIGAADLSQLLHGADRTHPDVCGLTDPANPATRAATAALLRSVRGLGKEVYVPEPLFHAFVHERELLGDTQLKVCVWPDRLLAMLRRIVDRENETEARATSAVAPLASVSVGEGLAS